MSQQQQALRPFRFNTRARQQVINRQVWTSGGQFSQEIPRVGYINRLLLFVNGTFNGGAATTLNDSAPWNIINRLKVNINIGTAEIVDLTGYGAFLITSYQERGFRADRAGAGSTTPDTDLYAAGVASGDNSWSLCYVIPIGANQGLDFQLGMLLLQAPEVRLTLDVTWGQTSDVISTIGAGTGFAATFGMDIVMDYYEVPDPRTVQQPPFQLSRIKEESMAISNTGDNIYTVPRAGIITQLFNIVRINNARSNAIDGFLLKFNKTDTVYDRRRRAIKLENQLESGNTWPTGVFIQDLWHSGLGLSQGDMRDCVDTESIATVENICTVTSGTSLGAVGTNNLNVIRRYFQAISG